MWCYRAVASSRICFIVFVVALWIFSCGAWCQNSPFLASSKVVVLTTKLTAKKSVETEEVVALLHSHHLLDHKPDNLILKGGRHKLRGVACLGRPGVALCIGSPNALKKFRATLESAMPQKRFKTKMLATKSEGCSSWNGFESVSLGELRERLSSIGEEAEFFAITGIAPEIAKRGTPEEGGKAIKKKKRKRK